MSEDVALSIIVPVYNAAPYLPVLLASLLAQTHRDFEIIVVDDGSTDDSVSIIESFVSSDRRVRLLRQKNAGVSSARNRGLDVARGRWIGFADADDWIAPETYEIWLAQARQLDLDLLCGSSFRFEGATPKAPAWDGVSAARVVDGKRWMQEAVAARNWLHFVYLQLIRHDFLQRQSLRFVEGIVHEDVLWTAALMLGAPRVGQCPQPLYGYRITPGSLSGTDTPVIVRHRAESYFAVIDGLIAMARGQTGDAAVHAALMQQAGREAKHLYTVIAEDSAPGERAELAANFIARRYPQLIAEHGYGNRLRRHWRAFKARRVLAEIAQREHSTGIQGR